MAYSEEEKTNLINDICQRVSNGEALRTVLQSSDMPDSTTFYNWIDSDEEKSKQYARATSERADAIFEEILEIADENNADVYVDDAGEAKIDGNTVQRSKLKVDARKWMLSKMQPKKYGDKLDLTSKGGKIQNQQIIGMIVKDGSDETD